MLTLIIMKLACKFIKFKPLRSFLLETFQYIKMCLTVQFDMFWYWAYLPGKPYSVPDDLYLFVKFFNGHSFLLFVACTVKFDSALR